MSYTINERSHAEVLLDLEPGAYPDTVNPMLPDSPTIRPLHVKMSAWPNAAGEFAVSWIMVIGPKVKDGEVATKRHYDVMFNLDEDVIEPGDEPFEFKGPEWVREIAAEWQETLNGRGGFSANSPARGEAVKSQSSPLEDFLLLMSRRMEETPSPVDDTTDWQALAAKIEGIAKSRAAEEGH